MSDQSKSPRLEGDILRLTQQRDVFTLKDAARYCAGYLKVSQGDIDAAAEVKFFYDMLEDAAKKGQLGEVKPEKKMGRPPPHPRRGLLTDELPPRVVPVDDWREAEVSRDSLRSFAESKGVRPDFLFPKGNGDVSSCYSEPSTEGAGDDSSCYSEFSTEEVGERELENVWGVIGGLALALHNVSVKMTDPDSENPQPTTLANHVLLAIEQTYGKKIHGLGKTNLREKIRIGLDTLHEKATRNS